MNGALLGWGLAVVAIAVGFTAYGWPGVALALTLLVFWLLLQFSRSVRALRDATGRPVGQVPNAVMMNARMRKGMRLPDVLRMTRSLGNKLADTPETYAWRDDADDAVHVELVNGRVTQWTLQRAISDANNDIRAANVASEASDVNPAT